MFFDRPESGQRTLLVSLRFDDSTTGHNLEEFSELARSAELDPVHELKVNRHKADSRFGIGRGKVDELKEEVAYYDAELVIFDADLTPSQQRNLEAALKRRVLSRTELILTLFEERARTHEGKLQVELALLKHAQSSVVGGWSHLDRQRGGVNMRGAGELQSSIDKGLIQRRIHSVQQQLNKVERQRAQHRSQRRKNRVPTIALAGYTNAGKSTLFNALTKATVYADDRLFATLDPTMRRLSVPELGTTLLADTVGFIRDLPPSLVAAFKATLEEVSQADLLLHVIDCSVEDVEQIVDDVCQTLVDIGADQVPVINVFNKADRITDRQINGFEGVWVSAVEHTGFDELLTQISRHLKGCQQTYVVDIPAREGKLRAWLHSIDAVREEAFGETGNALITASLDEGTVARVQATPGVAVKMATTH